MSDHYGFVYHPETGACIAKVEDGKVVGVDGRSYRLEGDRILGEDSRSSAISPRSSARPSAPPTWRTSCSGGIERAVRAQGL